MARNVISSKGLYPTSRPLSYGVKAGDWVFTSGMPGLHQNGKIVGKTMARIDSDSQTRQALMNTKKIYDELNVPFDRAIKLKTYITDFRYKTNFRKIYREFFNHTFPANAFVGTSLSCVDTMIEIESVAKISGTISEIRSAKLVDPDLPCAQGGIYSDGFLYSSGHLSRNLKNELVGLGDIRAQTEQSLDNIGLTLEAAGLSFSDVVIVNTTVADSKSIRVYNEIFMKYFHEPFGTRATIQGILPVEGAQIMFEVFATKGPKRIVSSREAAAGHFTIKRLDNAIYHPGLYASVSPQSHAIQVGDIIYTSGEVSRDASGLTVGPGDIRAQTRRVMDTLFLCMETLGSGAEDIVKTNVTITDNRLIPAFDEEYGKYFTPPYPAQTIVVDGLSPEKMVVEIEAIGILGSSQNAVFVTGSY